MVVPEHEAEWPDKAMFAGILLTLSGALGVVFALLRFTDVSFGQDIPALLQDWPTWIMLPASVVALIMGLIGTRHQAAVFVYLGSLAGIASLAGLGIVPLLCIVAAGFMVKAHVEGEDTVMATPTPDAGDWPDKALAASLLLFVTGFLTVFQAILTYAGRFSPVAWVDAPAIWATIQLLLGAYVLWSSRQIFRLRRRWAGLIGAVAGLAGMALYVFGPLLAIVALILLGLAGREDEFMDGSTPGA